MKSPTVVLILTLMFTQSGFCATKVMSTNHRKQPLEMVIEHNMARFNGAQKHNYQLINLDTHKTYNINTRQGTALDMSISANVPVPKKVKLPKVQLKKIGGGPKIASYATLHYQLLANGKLCENLFVSPKASKLEGMKTLIGVMGEMANASKGAMLSAGGTPCRIASTLIFEKFARIGILMKSVNTQGQVTLEITRIETDVALDGAYFDIPKGIEVMTLQNLMRRMRKSAQQ